MGRKSHYALGIYAVMPILIRLPNKRNMLLEAIAVLFLCPRDDIIQLVRATSEANEHTYGMLRQILREFTVEQLIYLVNKVNK